MNIEGFIRTSSSFSDFFEKAKELTNKERGDAFERVVQLHLQSKPKYASELDAVWQLHEVPKDVRKHLKLPDADEGIDLIAKHVDGTYWAIQAKYRGKPADSLKWGDICYAGGGGTMCSYASSIQKGIDLFNKNHKDRDWAWDQFYHSTGSLVWACRGVQTGQFAEKYRCAGKSQNDYRWPNK